MAKKQSAHFDIYLARIRQAQECLPENRTPEQKQLLKSSETAPSYVSLFGNDRAGDTQSKKPK